MACLHAVHSLDLEFKRKDMKSRLAIGSIRNRRSTNHRRHGVLLAELYQLYHNFGRCPNFPNTPASEDFPAKIERQDVEKVLGNTLPAVSKAVQRGEKLVLQNNLELMGKKKNL
jgi:hypothetical protein